MTRTRNREATRRALLSAGARLFAERGYEAATIEALAETAGVTKAMVRYYFEDKAGLYREVLEETFDHIAAAIQPVRDMNLPPQEKLELYVQRLADAIRERPHIGNLLVTGHVSGRIAGDRRLVVSLTRLYRNTQAIMSEGARKGVFRKLDAHLFHLLLVGSISFFVGSQQFRDDLAKDPPWAGPTPNFKRFLRLLQDFTRAGASTTPGRPK